MHLSETQNHSKQKYREFCKTEETIPIFSKDWWLDAVAGADNWAAVVIEGNGRILATFPYWYRKKYWFTMLKMPAFTQKLGPWLRYPDGIKYYDKLSFEKKVLTEIIENLPRFDWFEQAFDYTITNWLPFYWKGFKQTTRYTYVIEKISDLDYVLRNFEYSKRKNIKRAEKTLEIKYDLPAKDFYENHKMTLLKQNSRIVYSLNTFRQLYETCYAHNSGKTIYCLDEDNNIHSALFVVWDKNSAYDLISTIDPDFRASGSASLLVKEIISFLSDKTKKFDFEGSMIANVERSFRRFGAIQKSYFRITKIMSRLLKFYNCLRDVDGKIET